MLSRHTSRRRLHGAAGGYRLRWRSQGMSRGRRCIRVGGAGGLILLASLALETPADSTGADQSRRPAKAGGEGRKGVLPPYLYAALFEFHKKLARRNGPPAFSDDLRRYVLGFRNAPGCADAGARHVMLLRAHNRFRNRTFSLKALVTLNKRVPFRYLPKGGGAMPSPIAPPRPCGRSRYVVPVIETRRVAALPCGHRPCRQWPWATATAWGLRLPRRSPDRRSSWQAGSDRGGAWDVWAWP